MNYRRHFVETTTNYTWLVAHEHCEVEVSPVKKIVVYISGLIKKTCKLDVFLPNVFPDIGVFSSPMLYDAFGYSQQKWTVRDLRVYPWEGYTSMHCESVK